MAKTAQIYSVRTLDAQGFGWAWRGSDGKQQSSQTFVYFYDCVVDAEAPAIPWSLAALLRRGWMAESTRGSRTATSDKAGTFVTWKIFTKQVKTGEGGIALRWFWRQPVLEGRRQSPEGFTTRAACEADAAKHGYTRENETPGTETPGRFWE